MRAAVVAGLVVGSLLIAAVALTHDASEPAATQFVDAWRRSLTSTYVVVDRLDRRLVDGRRFTTETRLAQRPPDRVSISGGRVDGWRDGRRLACAAGPGGVITCADGGPAPAYADFVRRELADLRALVVARPSAYDVRRAGGGCFALRLRARILAPPYGEDATFCFDRTTGALRSSVVRRAEATDVHRAVRLDGRVSDADLAPPATQ